MTLEPAPSRNAIRSALLCLLVSLFSAGCSTYVYETGATTEAANDAYSADMELCRPSSLDTEERARAFLNCIELAERRFAANIKLRRPDLLEKYLARLGTELGNLARSENPTYEQGVALGSRLRREYLAAIVAAR